MDILQCLMCIISKRRIWHPITTVKAISGAFPKLNAAQLRNSHSWSQTITFTPRATSIKVSSCFCSLDLFFSQHKNHLSISTNQGAIVKPLERLVLTVYFYLYVTSLPNSRPPFQIGRDEDRFSGPGALSLASAQVTSGLQGKIRPAC